jgi:hypothetical protein
MSRPGSNASAALPCAVALALATGCSAAPAQDDAAEIIHRTVVHVDAQGVPHATTTVISREEQLREIGARGYRLQHAPLATPDTAVDGGCASSSMWVYDRPNLAGNEICFDGVGTIDLTTQYFALLACLTSHVCEPVAGHVRSFWAGESMGSFGGKNGCSESFGAYQRVPSVDTCGLTSQSLFLQFVIVPL